MGGWGRVNHTMTPAMDEDYDKVGVSVTFPEALADEIARQTESDDYGVAHNTSEWFRNALMFHSNVSEFIDEARMGGDSGIHGFLGAGTQENPESRMTRTTIKVYQKDIDLAEQAVEAGVVDSRSEWFRDAAYTLLGIQQMAHKAGAHLISDEILSEAMSEADGVTGDAE